jgi:hypothetical protein
MLLPTSMDDQLSSLLIGVRENLQFPEGNWVRRCRRSIGS